MNNLLLVFFDKLTQVEKTRSLGKIFVSLGNLIINSIFEVYKSITFFVTSTLFLSIAEFAFLVTNEMMLNKNKSEVNRENSKLIVIKF